MKKEIKIGAFALGMVVLLYFAINFIRGTSLFGNSVSYYAVYPKVSGLHPQSQVLIKGIAVGTVGNIALSSNSGGEVIVQLNIRSRYNIPSDSEARIFTDGFLGGKAVEVVIGSSNNYLSRGDTLRSSIEVDLIEALTSELENVKAAGGKIVDNFMETVTRINTLLEQNTEAINMTMNNLSAISSDIKSVTSSQNAHIQNLITNLSLFSASLNSSSEDLTEALANINAITDSLKQSNLPLVIDSFAATVGQIDTLLEKINSGDGTMGKLVNDDALYDSLATSLGTLNRLMQDLQEHPGRYINLSIFGRRK